MNTQPKSRSDVEALRLADKLECKTSHIGGPTMHDAAAELRRLHTLNQELLEALSAIRNSADAAIRARSNN